MKIATLAFNIIALNICFLENTFSQQWKMMDTMVSDYGGSQSWITVDNNGIPFIVFSDDLHGGTTVKKFNGNNWITVGTEAFSGWSSGNSIAFDNMNTPYVAFCNEQNDFKATTMKFDGTNWISVGANGFSPDRGGYTSLAIDKNGTPYVGFVDRDTIIGIHGATVMKFDGSNWVYVGARSFSQGNVLYTSLALDNNGMPCIAYWDMSDVMSNQPFKVGVMKFDGTNWVKIGMPPFVEWISGNSQAIAFDSNNIPYIVCSVGGKTTVMKFDGNNWATVGAPGISQGGAGFPSIIIDKNDILYISYTDGANGQKANVKKFDGANWVSVGNPDFSPTACFFLMLALDTNGNAYVAFKDATPHYFYWNNNYYTHYPFVAMKLESNASGISEVKNSSLLTVYPNPGKGVFQIHYASENMGKLQLKIMDAKGKIVYMESVPQFNGEFSKSIDLGRKAKGIYFIEAILGNESYPGERRTRKIILE